MCSLQARPRERYRLLASGAHLAIGVVPGCFHEAAVAVDGPRVVLGRGEKRGIGLPELAMLLAAKGRLLRSTLFIDRPSLEIEVGREQTGRRATATGLQGATRAINRFVLPLHEQLYAVRRLVVVDQAATCVAQPNGICGRSSLAAAHPSRVTRPAGRGGCDMRSDADAARVPRDARSRRWNVTRWVGASIPHLLGDRAENRDGEVIAVAGARAARNTPRRLMPPGLTARHGTRW